MTNKLFDLNIKLKGDLKAHDPAMVKENDQWYLVHTGKGIGFKSSKNLSEWSSQNSILNEPLPWWDNYVENFDRENDAWAPDLEYFNGKWWLYYSVSEFGTKNSLIGLLSADSIEAADWQDEGLVITSTQDQDFNSIDPNLFIDPAGNSWLVFGSWFNGIKLTKLNPETMKPEGKIYSLAHRLVGKRPAGIEAPTLTYKDGYYYLFASIDHCCRGNKSDYKIAYGRAEAVTGPYYDQNGISLMEKGGSILAAADKEFTGYGGQDIFENKYLVHHAYHRRSGEYRFFIKELDWEDGWPKIKNYDLKINSYYKLRNLENQKTAAVEAAKTEARARIICNNNQKAHTNHWLIYPVDADHYRIQNKNSLLYLEVGDADKADGADVQQWSNTRHICQEWELINLRDNIYKIINRNSGKALTKLEDDYLVQKEDQDLDSQKWKLVSL
ncbi:ricin-type beta-trefoil lectin protein [Halanaerobium saccharolyticum]|jgi:beta-xylosidase|uniref:Ricin-type beta-trefoil lectin protein n=1 Tax=Halanaerobium saccharolyticum TaxID=43595 RepID=A0A4R6SJH4_9FIRM|nr:family 43 glycosylhydrolase [Halanaerobium saccharolyticum]TDQ03944.1 ricin-type beta-trefoil lectin protein [Halanaerobium saccharolyticum]